MKLVPVILTFDGSTATFTCKDSEHKLVLLAAEKGLKTQTFPEKFNDPASDEEIPDELENLIGAAAIFGPDLHVMLHSTDPSTINRQRIGISMLQEQLERGKVKYPQAVEHMLLVQIIAIATGMEPGMVHALGMAHKEVESVATPAEQTLKDSLARGEYVEGVVSDVVLNYDPVQPPLTAADRALMDADAATKH